MLILEQDVQQVANEVMNMLHEDEVELINNFHDAVVANDTEKIDELFNELVAEVEAHFRSEEDMMEGNGFGGYQIHKNDHDIIRKKLKKFHDRWKVLKSSTEVKNFLEKDFKKLWTTHISRWDSEAAMQMGDS